MKVGFHSSQEKESIKIVLDKLAHHSEKNKAHLQISLRLYIKINSMWFKNLNVKHGIIEVPEKNLG